jgi:hypothetical protein
MKWNRLACLVAGGEAGGPYPDWGFMTKLFKELGITAIRHGKPELATALITFGSLPGLVLEFHCNAVWLKFMLSSNTLKYEWHCGTLDVAHEQQLLLGLVVLHLWSNTVIRFQYMPSKMFVRQIFWFFSNRPMAMDIDGLPSGLKGTARNAN